MKEEANMKNEQLLDVAVVGAGFSGMYLLHRLRDELGLNVQLFEALASSEIFTFKV